MNTLKRLLSLTLALVMTLTFLCSCGDIEELPDGPITSGDPVVTDVPDVTDAPDTTPEETTTTPATTPEVTTTPATTPEETTTTPATTPEVTTTEDKNAFTVEEMSAVMYATISLNVRSGPSTDFDAIDTLREGEEVIVTGRASTGWYQILVDGEVGYASNVYLTSEKPEDSSDDNDDGEVVIDDDDDDVTVEDDSNNNNNNNNNTPSIDTGNDITGVSADDSWVKGNGWTYMYNALYKDSYRQVLSEIMTGIKNYRTDIKFSPILSDSEVDEFIEYFRSIITVEYTYVRTIKPLKSPTTNKTVGVRVYYYVNSENAGDKMVSELQSAADKVIGKLKSSWSDYEKVLYLHDWLVTNCKADEHSYENDEDDWGKTLWPTSAYGAIVDGQPTCLGYAKGMFYLLSRAGFEVSFVKGVGTSAEHVWVKVKVDGKWYNIDPTWDDPYGAAQTADPNYVKYDYFMVTDKYIKDTRSDVYDIIFFDDPECSATKYDWYRYNDCYAESYDEAVKILKEQAKKAAKSGGKIEYVSIKLSSDSLYEDVKDTWSSTKFVSDILSDYTSAYDEVKRGANTAGRTLTFRLYK